MTTYYFIPLTLLKGQFGTFLLIAILLLTSVLCGLVLITTLALPYMQRGVIWLIMCLSPSDRPLNKIIVNRLESGQARNLKIALMVSCSIGFLTLCTSAAFTVIGYFEHLWHWYMAGDLILSFE